MCDFLPVGGINEKRHVFLIGLHSDGRTTKCRTTYNRTTNHRTICAMVCTTCNYVCGGLTSIGDGMTGNFLSCSLELTNFFFVLHRWLLYKCIFGDKLER